MTSRVLLLLMIADVSNAQSANYVRYDNYSAVDFDNSTGCFVPLLSDCLALSNAAPLTNGVVYNDGLKTCKVLTATNNEVLVKLHAKAGWVTFVKNNSDVYRPIFKVTAAYTTVQGNADIAQLINGTSTAYTSTYNSSIASLVKAESCNCAYRNPVLDYWSSISINTVKLEFFSGGLTTVSATFNVQNAALTGWFTKSNLIAAVPYSTSTLRLGTGLTYEYSDPNYYGRFFKLSGVQASCSNDNYYILVSNRGSCSYELSPYPKIYYSAALQESTTDKSLVPGDFFSISAKFYNRVVIVP